MLLAAPAVAGTVYRCTGADGSSSYSSDRIDGARCKAVSNFKPAPAAASPTNAPKRVTGQVYSYVEGGVRHYSSKRPRGQVDALRTISYSYIETCSACVTRSKVHFGPVRLNTSASGDPNPAAAETYGAAPAGARPTPPPHPPLP